MRRPLILFIALFFGLISAETLFQVKDSSDNVVLDVASDGLRIFNEGDTLMVISSGAIKAFIDHNSQKGLARSFSVTSSTNVKSGQANVMEVTTDATTMREGNAGERYTDFSPENIFLGLNSGSAIEPDTGTGTGIDNVFVGNQSGISNTEGSHGVFIGSEAGYFNNTGFGNVFIGQGSGRMNSSSSLNTYVGTFAGYNSTGVVNTYIGFESGYSNTTGSGNTFVGRSTGRNTLTGSDNTVLGTNAFTQSEGNSNTIIGAFAGRGSTSGDFQENVFVGQSSGYNKLSGYKNVYIGNSSGYNNETGYGNIFIGNRSGFSETGSDKLYIANTDTSTPLIKGTFPNTDLTFKATTITADGNFSVTGLTSLATLTTSGNTTINGNMGIGTAPSSSYAIYAKDDYYGVRGEANTSSGNYTYGVYGRATGAATANYAVRGYAYATTGANNYGIYGYAGGSGPCFAGYFSGNVHVTGTLSKAKDETKIDHPLDPENKILSHSGVISDEMTSVYNGNVVLDGSGNAKVQLPEWFEAMNTDFKYQLTAIGAPGPNLYIAREISNNSFDISGGEADSKVSWQITAVRNDNYAKSNPLEIESKKKTDEIGYYLHPESFGLSEEMSIDHQLRKKEEEENNLNN